MSKYVRYGGKLYKAVDADGFRSLSTASRLLKDATKHLAEAEKAMKKGDSAILHFSLNKASFYAESASKWIEDCKKEVDK